MSTTCGMAYRRAGKGAPIVLLHGIPGQGASWSKVEPLLTSKFDVITPDLIGFGASRRPDEPSIADVGPVAQAVGVSELLDELDVAGATIVGHDFGVPIALLLAEARPELANSLVLLAGNAFPDTPIPFPLSLTKAPLLGGAFARLLFSSPSLSLMLRKGVGRGSPPPEAEVYLGDRRQQRTIGVIFEKALTQLAELYGPVALALEKTDVQTLVGWGDSDPFFPITQGRRLAEKAGAQFRLYEGAGHFLPHERPTEVANDIAAIAEAAQK